MRFEKIELESDETITATIRRHWFYLFKQCFSIAVLIVLPLCMTVAVLSLGGIPALLSAYMPHAFFAYVVWLLLLWMLLATLWTDHYLDTWTITNKRIIKIDQVSLFRREIASFRLERLQDMHVEINGILATLLDYGTLHAETASGDSDEFKATYLPKPREVKALILKAADERMDQGSAV